MTERDYVAYAVTAGLGFATVENLGYIYASAAGHDSASVIAVTALERIAFGFPSHVLTAVLTAINMARRDVKKERLRGWDIIAPSTFYHGLSDFALFGACALMGHVGWVHPTTVGTYLRTIVVPVGCLVALCFHVKSSLAGIGLAMGL